MASNACDHIHHAVRHQEVITPNQKARQRVFFSSQKEIKMLEKTIAFENYNGEPVERTYYFNISRAEAIRLQWSEKGGLDSVIKKISAEMDATKIYPLFEEVLLKSVGEKSADGMRFIKTQEIRDEFAQSEAMSELIVELLTEEGAAAAFFNAIAPKVPSDRKEKEKPLAE